MEKWNDPVEVVRTSYEAIELRDRMQGIVDKFPDGFLPPDGKEWQCWIGHLNRFIEKGEIPSTIDGVVVKGWLAGKLEI